MWKGFNLIIKTRKIAWAISSIESEKGIKLVWWVTVARRISWSKHLRKAERETGHEKCKSITWLEIKNERSQGTELKGSSRVVD